MAVAPEAVAPEAVAPEAVLPGAVPPPVVSPRGSMRRQHRRRRSDRRLPQPRVLATSDADAAGRPGGQVSGEAAEARARARCPRCRRGRAWPRPPQAPCSAARAGRPARPAHPGSLRSWPDGGRRHPARPARWRQPCRPQAPGASRRTSGPSSRPVPVAPADAGERRRHAVYLARSCPRAACWIQAPHTLPNGEAPLAVQCRTCQQSAAAGSHALCSTSGGRSYVIVTI